MKVRFAAVLSALLVAVGLASCVIFSIQMPERTSAGATITATLEMGQAFISDQNPVTLCTSFPNDWTVNAAPNYVIHRTPEVTGTFEPITTPGGLPTYDGATWLCWQSDVDVEAGDYATTSINATVGAAGTYVTHFAFHAGSASGPTISSRAIAIDALPVFDANAHVHGDVTDQGVDIYGVFALTTTSSGFVALTSNGDVVSYGDGLSITDAPVLGTITSTSQNYSVISMQSGGGLLVTIGYTSDPDGNGDTSDAHGIIWVSNDNGVTWTESPQSFAPLNAIAYDSTNARFLAIGAFQTVYVSADGTTWTPHLGPNTTYAFTEVATGGGQTVLLSSGTSDFYTLSADATISTGAITVADYATTTYNNVAYAPELGFVFSTVDAVVVSADLATGTAFVLGAQDDIQAMAGNTEAYVLTETALYRLTASGLREIGVASPSSIESVVASTENRTLFLSQPSLINYALTIDRPRLAAEVGTATASSVAVTVRNNGAGDLYLETPTASAGLTVSGCEALVVAEGASCTLTVSGAASTSGSVSIVSNGTIDPATVTLNVTLAAESNDSGDGGTDSGEDSGASDGDDDDGCAATPVSPLALLGVIQVLRRARRQR